MSKSFHLSTGPIGPSEDRRVSGAVPDEPPGSLANVLRKQMEHERMSIYQLSQTSGVDAAYIWRILHGERNQVSREILIRLSLALVLNEQNTERVVEVASELLDAAGFKSLH